MDEKKACKPVKPVVVLIHGTFATGTNWTKPDSLFAKALRKEFGEEIDIRSFPWSGKNSHKERQDAGAQLSLFLEMWNRLQPLERYILIAHSHGGNVALHSLLTTRRLTSAMVTLATPFLMCRKRDLGGFGLVDLFLKFALVGALGCLAVSPFAGVGLLLGDSHGALLGACLGAVLVFWFFVLVEEHHLPFDWPFETEWSGIENRLRVSQDEIHYKFTFPDPERTPFLCLRISGDEAKGWLDIVRAIASVPFRVWSNHTAFHVSFALVFVSAFRFLLFKTWALLDPLPLRVYEKGVVSVVCGGLLASLATALVFLTISFLAHMTMLLIPKLVRSHTFAFGGETFLDNWLVDVWSKETPHGSQNLIQHTYDSRPNRVFLRLRHSALYNDKKVIDDICVWLRAILRDVSDNQVGS